MMEAPKIWIYPHRPEHVGGLGIDQFRKDLEMKMSSVPSWERHWGQGNKGRLSAKKGDIVIFSFKENGSWNVVGDAVVLYEGIFEGYDDCKKYKRQGWKACYHFESFRLYSRSIPYSELEKSLDSFEPNARQVVKLTGDDYLRMMKRTVVDQAD